MNKISFKQLTGAMIFIGTVFNAVDAGAVGGTNRDAPFPLPYDYVQGSTNTSANKLLLCASNYVPDEQGRQNRGRKTMDELNVEREESLAKRKSSQEKFVSNLEKFDIRGIRIGDPVEKVKDILSKNFQKSSCGSVECIGESKSNDVLSEDKRRENIVISLVGKDSLAASIFYSQNIPFAEGLSDCIEKSSGAAQKLTSKFGDPFFYVRDPYATDPRYVTIGWGNIGTVDNTGAIVSDLKDRGNNRVVGEGFIAIFACNEKGRLELSMHMLSGSFSEKNKYKPQGQDVKF